MTAPDRVTARNLYLYVVCLITLLIALVAAVQLVRSIVGIVYPEPDYAFSWYATTGIESESGIETDGEAYLADEQKDAAEDAQRRSEVRGALTAGTTLLLSAGLYVAHWRRVQSERRPATAPVVPAEPPTP